MMRNVLRVGLGGMLLIAAAAPSWADTSIPVPEGSFENAPIIPAFGVAVSDPPWALADGPTDPGFGAGVFPNTPGTPRTGTHGGFLANGDANNAAFIFSDPGNSFTQGLRATSDPLSAETDFMAGTYTLSAKFALAGSPPPAGQKLLISLYYLDSALQKHTIATTPITAPASTGTVGVPASDTDTAPADFVQVPVYDTTTPHADNPYGLNTATLVPISLTTSLLAGDAAIGKQIFISIATDPSNAAPTAQNPNAGGGEFDFDNVTLSFVPEPATLSLLTLPAMLLLRRRNSR